MRSPAGKLVAAGLLVAACSSPAPPDPYCSSEPLAGDAGVKAGQAALRVDGTTSVQFLVFDPQGKAVENKLLGGTIALPPGKYQIRVNNSAHTVTVAAGKLTRCATGTLLVSGTTEETWFVHDLSGAALQQTPLGKAMSLVPGKFRVKVNNTENAAEVRPSEVTELATGTLIVAGGGTGQYHVTDKAGASLNYQSLNKAVALFPGEYNVTLGETRRTATVEAGRQTPVRF
jgi:hypothetical protein